MPDLKCVRIVMKPTHMRTILAADLPFTFEGARHAPSEAGPLVTRNQGWDIYLESSLGRGAKLLLEVFRARPRNARTGSQLQVQTSSFTSLSAIRRQLNNRVSGACQLLSLTNTEVSPN